jgi:ElaB/YqjD/DUF883 family membrane-anchored ribosome-binding protein
MSEDRKEVEEIAALRAEIKALKSDRTKRMHKAAEEASKRAEAAATDDELEPTTPAHDQLKEFELAVGGLSEALEEEISERPIIAVGAALLLGILIGRLSAR